MIDADQWREPNTTRTPEGMPWEDWQAWRPWLAGPGAQWPRYAYNVHLLTQAMPPGETDPGMIRMWLANTAKRIDAIGDRGGVIDIFEARRFAGWSAIAQLLGYKDLWLINFPALMLGDLWLITERIDDPTRATAARHGIRTWVVGEDQPP